MTAAAAPPVQERATLPSEALRDATRPCDAADRVRFGCAEPAAPTVAAQWQPSNAAALAHTAAGCLELAATKAAALAQADRGGRPQLARTVRRRSARCCVVQTCRTCVHAERSCLALHDLSLWARPLAHRGVASMVSEETEDHSNVRSLAQRIARTVDRSKVGSLSQSHTHRNRLRKSWTANVSGHAQSWT